jgi:hypothetical protein
VNRSPNLAIRARAGLAVLGLALLCAPGASRGVIISSQGDNNPNASAFVDDGVISSGEYPASYTGGGSGFGGTLGNGTLYMDADSSNLYIGFAPGASLNDNVVIHLDTKPGGFTDAQMNDTGDPGRNLLTNLTRDDDDTFPVLPDYGIVIGQFGEVSFELTNGALNFISFQNDQTGNSNTLAREFAIPRASLGDPSAVNFFVSYGSDTNFMSNESIPLEGFNAGANPGFGAGGGTVVHANHDQFLVPEPASIGLIGMGWIAGMRRRRQHR